MGGSSVGDSDSLAASGAEAFSPAAASAAVRCGATVAAGSTAAGTGGVIAVGRTRPGGGGEGLLGGEGRAEVAGVALGFGRGGGAADEDVIRQPRIIADIIRRVIICTLGEL